MPLPVLIALACILSPLAVAITVAIHFGGSLLGYGIAVLVGTALSIFSGWVFFGFWHRYETYSFKAWQMPLIYVSFYIISGFGITFLSGIITGELIMRIVA